MSLSSRFAEAFPGVTAPRLADADARIRDVLPPDLVAFWEELGWGGFGEGIVWFEDPARLVPCYRRWPVDLESIVPFARTSFGCLYVWADAEVTLYEVHFGRSYGILPSFTQFANDYLPSSEARGDELREDLHRQAVQRLGLLEPDEMYTFVPALALGGSESIEYVKKVKLLEQLALLAQIHLA